MRRAWVATLLLALANIAFSADSIRVHDPTMIRQGDTYYLFGTGRGISVQSSKDMKTWREEPPVFERAPEWTFTAVPGFKGHIWAPDISEHGGTYYLYYAISLSGKITSAIGVATNKTLDRTSPDFGWIDRGMVLQSVLNRDLWNAIDPQLVIDEQGTPWLAFGSFWSGLKLTKLNTELTRLADPQEWYPSPNASARCSSRTAVRSRQRSRHRSSSGRATTTICSYRGTTAAVARAATTRS
jgi:arabinan endo-1,5-alpha-L-arabinosidase